MTKRSILVVALVVGAWCTVGIEGPVVAADPWIRVVELTAPSPQDEASLGRSVALAGSIVVAGANGGEEHAGEAHVFRRDPIAGDWVHDQKLTAPDSVGADLYGTAVATDGKRIVVGDPSSDAHRGVVHVYKLDPVARNWIHEEELSNADAADGDSLGLAVAIEDDLIVAGTRFSGAEYSGRGAVHLFALDPTSGDWKYRQELTDPNAANGDSLGASVAIGDGRIVAGAPGDDGDTVNEGAAHVFARDPSTELWVHDQELRAPSPILGAQLGEAVAIEGDRVVVGALGPNNTIDAMGAVHVFGIEASTEDWVQQQALSHPDPEYGDFVGASVAIEGDVIVAGAPGDDGYFGAAHVFRHRPATDAWVYEQKLTDPNASDIDQLGASVSIDAGSIAAGAPGDDGAGSRRGAMHVFSVNRAPIVEPLTLSLSEDTPLGVIGTIEATDPDADPLTYAITGGNGLALLDVNGTTGAVILVGELNYEIATQIAATVTVSDGLNDVDSELTVHVTDVGGFFDVVVDPSADSFVDDDNSVFESDIEWMAAAGITRGCNPPANTMYCPQQTVTRGQMAAFLHRALEVLVNPKRDAIDFTDDDDSVFADDIGWLSATGITKGCSATEFCPEDDVTRGQMAAFLVRALGYVDDGNGDLFIDDDTSVFEKDIDRLAMAGVTRGCNPPVNDRFCPTGIVTRGQMAAFLHRALG